MSAYDLANATNEDERQELALGALYWFFRMVQGGGPDGSDLDHAVMLDAQAAADWFDATMRAEGGWLPEFDRPKYRAIEETPETGGAEK